MMNQNWHLDSILMIYQKRKKESETENNQILKPKVDHSKNIKIKIKIFIDFRIIFCLHVTIKIIKKSKISF
jgi:hypothetical protein